MIRLGSVASVYSGKRNTCCCGCAGKHTYASQHRLWASAERGYDVKPDEVNDLVVLRLVNKMNRNWSDVTVDGNHCYMEAGSRIYIAYLKG